MRSKLVCRDCGTKNYTVDFYCKSCSSDLVEQKQASISTPLHKLITAVFAL
ncbi:hypothetical protein Halha_0312 [Halobacteroides halobius DSM 5150]|uniref:Uncharacterized protein n=1 Tax=Halobacteroides halobius (strain ATCC 35273 / DSM 5150 / MD-1) TaxID=748449 RepID=L0K4Z6_HALHC|nr:hypothetical protein [Halobacteroides halobius]AGB40322.1 hypothetical protein Halha_0312 [Halobacteroides halobius DSM 5150]